MVRHAVQFRGENANKEKSSKFEMEEHYKGRQKEVAAGIVDKQRAQAGEAKKRTAAKNARLNS